MAAAAAVADYVRQHPLLRDLLGISASSPSSASSNRSGTEGSNNGPSGDVKVAELSGGRINFVWRVSGPKGDVVVKYAAPFVRSIGPEFKLSQARLSVEAEAMAAAHAACPQHVPALLLYDAAAGVLVQELISGPQGRRRVKLVDALVPRADAVISSVDSAAASTEAVALPPPPPLAADLASLLAGYLLRNSVYELPCEEHAAAAERLRNGEVVAANAAVVFTDPWDTECIRNRVPSGLEQEVAQLRADALVRQEVSRLLHMYGSSAETLIHNDLTAGNILVPEPPAPGSAPASGTATGSEMHGSASRSDTHLIDWEFATYGPMAYDIGSLLGNLLLSYCATECRGVERQPAPAPLLRCITELWQELEARIRSYTPVRHAGGADAGDGEATVGAGPVALGEALAQRVLSDSLGYAGCVMARLVFGMHHYPALEAISCGRRRACCQRLALRLAATLLRPEERAARGWLGCSAEGADDGGNGSGGDGAGSGGGGCGMRRLVRDVEAWAAEAEAAERRG
ncbi:hypothetical protein PLESTM_000184300 [Pleodorina starrii]|nr:hypothetical protein PLESTM_000184300 [Pleodorina starrii]